MDILTPGEVARREWDNIAISLRFSGDPGGFSKIADREIPSEIYQYAESMEINIDERHYFTEEAAHLFSGLAGVAGKRLGLSGDVAKAFGRAYGWVRTSRRVPQELNNNRRDRHRNLIMQSMFFKLFFGDRIDYYWDFDCPDRSKRLRVIFERFKIWQYAEADFERQPIVRLDDKRAANEANMEITL